MDHEIYIDAFMSKLAEAGLSPEDFVKLALTIPSMRPFLSNIRRMIFPAVEETTKKVTKPVLGRVALRDTGLIGQPMTKAKPSPSVWATEGFGAPRVTHEELQAMKKLSSIVKTSYYYRKGFLEKVAEYKNIKRRG